ncbi:hypothetical protein [Helcococcus ovis]|uniref:hypothetical protein n=1 Tax=Helcococcus ovis TaxID=72026 RepID=UPI00143193E1|nr:hypothetical protein [Helcococcus ovis]
MLSEKINGINDVPIYENSKSAIVMKIDAPNIFNILNSLYATLIKNILFNRENM